MNYSSILLNRIFIPYRWCHICYMHLYQFLVLGYQYAYLTLQWGMSEKHWAWKWKAWILSFAQPRYLQLLKLGGGWLLSFSVFLLLHCYMNNWTNQWFSVLWNHWAFSSDGRLSGAQNVKDSLAEKWNLGLISWKWGVREGTLSIRQQFPSSCSQPSCILLGPWMELLE